MRTRLPDLGVSLSPLQLGHVRTHAFVAGEQRPGRLQALRLLLAGGQQFGRTLAHLDLQLDLLLQVQLLKQNKKRRVNSLFVLLWGFLFYGHTALYCELGNERKTTHDALCAPKAVSALNELQVASTFLHSDY